MQRRHLLLAGLPLHAAHAADRAMPLKVIASFSILADMLREVAGESAQVGALVGPNADAHVFEPTPADALRLAGADLVVINGVGFEGWIERLIRASGYRGTLVVASEGIAPRRAGRAADPHAWHSLANAERYVENLRATLSAARPDDAAGFAQRAGAYRARLRELDAGARARFAALPADTRRVISSHDAFGYFGEAYGVQFIVPRGWSTDAEASAAQVALIVRQLRAWQARALFVENISDGRLIERIARDAGATVGGKLYPTPCRRPAPRPTPTCA